MAVNLHVNSITKRNIDRQSTAPGGSGRLTATQGAANAANGAASTTEPRGSTDRAQISGEAEASPRNTMAEQLDAASLFLAPGFTIGRRGAELLSVQSGLLNPPDHNRLGSYEATVGHERGTVGRGANNSIGAIYMLLGTFGQDRIGDVFNSPEAQATLPHSVNSEANGQLASTEFGYWQDQWNGQRSEGGFMGSMFSPTVREGIQSLMSNF